VLRLIKKKRPKSLQELARLAGRDMRAVITDVEILKNLDLIDIKRKKLAGRSPCQRLITTR
jgi:predicted transcriptional regulator